MYKTIAAKENSASNRRTLCMLKRPVALGNKTKVEKALASIPAPITILAEVTLKPFAFVR